MRRLLFALALALGLVLSFPLSSRAADPAITNPDFASGLSGWSVYGAVSARNDAGVSAAQVVGYAGISQVIKVAPQTEYTMSVRVRMSGPGQEVRCALQEPVSEAIVWANVTATTYQTVTARLRSGAAGQLKLICYVPQRSGTALVDSFALAAVAAPTPPPTATATVAPTSTPAPTTVPTATPEPTAVPTNTAEPTALPSATPEPSATAMTEPTPLPTTATEPTPLPTTTTEPTPLPTDAPAPTAPPLDAAAATIVPTAAPSGEGTPVQPFPATLPVRTVGELVLQASQPVANPYTDQQISAVFTGPDGSTRTVAGFWLRDALWGVRFTPEQAGTYTYQVTSQPADPGLRISGSFTAVASAARGFVRRAPSTPSFVFDDGSDAFVLGQTYYEIVRVAAAGDTGWETALSESAARGFTKVRLLVQPWGDPDPFGEPTFPFRNNDHDQLNPTYLAALDRVVSAIAARGMTAELVLFADTDFAFGTQDQDERFARYLLARYAANPAVTWCLSNEWEYTGLPRARWEQLGQIVQREDPYAVSASGLRRALSIHNRTFKTFQFGDASWPTHSVVQWGVRNKDNDTGGDVWGSQSILANRDLLGGGPVVNDEFGYLGERFPGGQPLTREQHRRALWGIGIAGGYASVGDARPVNGTPVIIASQWLDAPEYDDVRVFAQFWRDQPRTLVPVSARVSGARAYALGDAKTTIVYAAAGGTLRLTLPAPASCVKLDVVTGKITDLGAAGASQTIVLPDGADAAVVCRH